MSEYQDKRIAELIIENNFGSLTGRAIINKYYDEIMEAKDLGFSNSSIYKAIKMKEPEFSIKIYSFNTILNDEFKKRKNATSNTVPTNTSTSNGQEQS